MSSEALGTTLSPLGGPLKGSLVVPGDKSISHRALFFSAMAKGTSQLCGVLDSADIRSSIQALMALGAQVCLEKQCDGSLAGGITGWGEKGPQQPSTPLDCGNSGTSARLLLGLLAGWDIGAELTGDDSLKRRPMRRIIAPLMKMGAHFSPEGCERLPLVVEGTSMLHPLSYQSPMASAQLKTAVLLAGMQACGTTTIIEPAPSRNHTELMLPEFGVDVVCGENTAQLTGPVIPRAAEVLVPGDPSSAAFLLCAAALIPGSSLHVEKVSLNPARIGFTRTLERMGVSLSLHHEGSAGKEPYGTISLCYTPHIHGCEIPAHHIASLVDEIPVLALVAAHAHGITVFRGVEELRVKETDRLEAIVGGLTILGVNAWIDGNDLFIEGSPGLRVNPHLIFDSQGDHRLAMAWALVGLCGEHPVQVRNFDCIAISYPRFLHDMERLVR